MKHYEDKGNRKQVWEQHFDFKESGGYYLKIKYGPKNWFWKILHSLGLIHTQGPIAEIEQEPMNWEYIDVNFTKSNLKASGIFLTREGVKMFRMTIPNETVEKYDVNISFERLYS